MESSNVNPDHELETVETERPSPDFGTTMDDMLKQLRARRYYQEAMQLDSPQEPREEQETREDSSSNDLLSVTESEAAEEIEGEDNEDVDLVAAFDELGQEVRRLGRELFKSNRTAESNQGLFNQALVDIRQLTSVVSQITTQSDELLNQVRFEAKAEICRELLRMVDTLEASLGAADDLIKRLEAQAPQTARGFVFHFASVKGMHESLIGSVAALRQWRDGQRLLLERLRSIVQTAGVRAIESMGRTFDPAQHRAVSAELRSDVAPGMIIGEELRGYTLEGRILRYAEVVVVKNG